MSLINDALKRARQSQPANLAPAAGPSLRPIEPARSSGGGSEFVLPGLIIVVLALAGILFWQWFSGSHAAPVRARLIPNSVEATHAVVATQPVMVQPTPTVVTQPPVQPMVKSPEPAAETVATAAIVEAPKPAPITYKLQSIFFFAKNPSVMINGRTVFVGGKVGEAHVLAITQESVTIVTASGKTNILELPQ